MIVAQTSDGLEVTLKASGLGRLFGAAFLLMWLAFWVVGEVLVGSMLLQGGWSLLTGLPPGEGRAPLETAPAIVAGVFLLGWLAFWTLGGVLAGKELLRLLSGRDRLVLGPDAIMVERGFGLLRERQTMPRVSVRRFHRRSRGHAVGADTDHGSVELSDLGAPDEIDRLVAALNAEWRLDPDAPRSGFLPEGWNEALAPEGDAILIKDPSRRKKQAMVLWVVCLSLAAVGGYVLFAATAPESLRVIGLIIAAGGGFAGWGAYRLSWCRDEWVLGAGRLRLQRRVHGGAQPRFEALALRLEEHSDSDGDLWYKLVALDAGASPLLPIREARRHECGVMSVAGDPTDVDNLGRWLAQRCGLPLEDATTAEGRAREAERLRQQLAASGRVGRWMARRLRPEPGGTLPMIGCMKSWRMMMGYRLHEAGRSWSGILALAALFFGSCTAAWAECPVGDIEKALEAPLGTLKETETPVTDVQSTEGGVWRIYRRADGALDTLVRIDGGESGMDETRLSIVDDGAYGIAHTRVDYLRHAFIDDAGPNGTAKRTTEHFYFCDGKLHLPPEMYATLDNSAYAKAGEESRKRMLLDKDVAALTRSLR